MCLCLQCLFIPLLHACVFVLCKCRFVSLGCWVVSVWVQFSSSESESFIYPRGRLFSVQIGSRWQSAFFVVARGPDWLARGPLWCLCPAWLPQPQCGFNQRQLSAPERKIHRWGDRRDKIVLIMSWICNFYDKCECVCLLSLFSCPFLTLGAFLYCEICWTWRYMEVMTFHSVNCKDMETHHNSYKDLMNRETCRPSFLSTLQPPFELQGRKMKHSSFCLV